MNALARLTAILILGGAVTLSAGTPMSNGVLDNNLATVKTCLAGGEKINEIDKWGWTPLTWAVYYRYQPITEFLLANGADPNIQVEKRYGNIYKGATALVITAYYGYPEYTAMLLNKGAKLDITDAKGYTALNYAKEYKWTEVLDLLNTASAPAKAPDKTI